MPLQIALTGATGFIGTRLLNHLAARGDRVHVLSRNPAKTTGLPAVNGSFHWEGAHTPPPEAFFQGCDAVISLMGHPIAGRLTENRRREVYRSRIEGTRRLVETLARMKDRPRIFISGSGVNYYGDRGAEVLTEKTEPGTGFLAEVCRDWEAEALRARELGMRVVTLRTGIVLGQGGGALQAMLRPFQLGLGGPLAGGKNWMSWIHIEDICRLLLHALDHQGAATYNGTAPNPVTNRELSRELGRALHRPAVIPVPRTALRLLFGDGADEIILQSVRALPANAEKEGFVFSFPHLRAALQDILS